VWSEADDPAQRGRSSTERSGGATAFCVDCRRKAAGNGRDEPCKLRGLRTVLWAAGGEIPPADPAVNYFAVGHSSECFDYVKDWVEKKVRRHLARARRQKGLGREQWSSPWLYDTLRLFNSYRVRYGGSKAAPA